MKVSKRHHNHHRSSKGKFNGFSFHTIERFVLNYGLGISGAALLILGIIYLLHLNAGNDAFINLIQSLLSPESGISASRMDQTFSLRSVFSLTSVTLPGMISLAILYLPGFIPLILIFFIPNGKVLLKNSLILSGFLWLVFAQGKLFLFNAYNNGIFFQYFSTAFDCFLVIQIILVLISILSKNRFAFSLSVIFFFISIVLIRSYFGGMMPYCMLLIIFQVIVLLFSLRFKWNTPFLLMMSISACYLIFYILRKIVFAANPQPVSYLLPAIMAWFFITVTGLGILNPKFRQKITSVLWDSLSYICLILVSATVTSMVVISGMYNIYLFYTAIVTIALITIAIINVKFDFLKSKKTFYFLTCIFSAFFIPQLFFSQFFLILAVSLSVALLIHTNLTHSRTSMNLSKVFFIITIVLYLTGLGLNIIPGVINMKETGEIYSLHLVLSAVLISSAIYFYFRLHSYLVKEYHYLNVKSLLTSGIMETLLLLIVYSSGFLVINYTLISIFPGYLPNLVELAMFTYAYMLLIFILRPSGSKYILIIRITLSTLAIVLYPLIIHSEAGVYRNLFLEGNILALIPFLMHYFCLGLIFLIIFQVNGFLSKLFLDKRLIRHIIQLIIIVFTTFILLTEYDNFSLVWFNRLSDLSVTEILRTGQFLPYSIIILIFSISILIYSLVHYSRFIRRVSLIMIMLVLSKIFFWDLKILSDSLIVILLVAAGLILLIVSLIINRMRKIRKKKYLLRRGTTSGVITSQ